MKRFFAILCCAVMILMILPSIAMAAGEGNVDQGGGGMGQGTSTNKWTPGNDGVRITVVDAGSGQAVSGAIDFSNRVQPDSLLHFGKVNKIQYRDGAGLSPRNGIPYTSRQPEHSMPPVINSKSRPTSIEVIKKYFCSEYACKMVAEAAGADYGKMLSGEYKILMEPIAYVTYNGQKYCFTATEAALYDSLSGGALRQKLPTVAFQNLPLAMFLEYDDLGFSAWRGPKAGVQSNPDIINCLGLGIVWFKEKPVEPDGSVEAPDVEYRVDTDVITSVTLGTNRNLTPDNPASVRFHINEHTYTVDHVVIPAGDTQVVWVKWHTPSKPQTITIEVSVKGAFTAKNHFTAQIVDLNDRIPPDPLATDTCPGYTVPPLPSNPQKTTADWGVWSCYWVPVWDWCDHDDWGHWVDRGYWDYDYTAYSARLSGSMILMPDDLVPTADGKVMKSGYGVKAEVSTILSTSAPASHFTYTQTALSTFPEFQYQAYSRLLERFSSGRNAKFRFKPNEFSTTGRNVHFLPVWFPDGKRFTVCTQVWDTWTPNGMLSVNVDDYVSVQGSVFDDYYTSRE